MIFTIDINGFIDNFSFDEEISFENKENLYIDNNLLPKDFEQQFQSYKLVNGKLVFDENQEQKIQEQNFLSYLRFERANKCFPIINRGQLWYNSLSNEQLEELKTWYQQWLNVTETLNIPLDLNWIK